MTGEESDRRIVEPDAAGADYLAVSSAVVPDRAGLSVLYGPLPEFDVPEIIPGSECYAHIFGRFCYSLLVQIEGRAKRLTG